MDSKKRMKQQTTCSYCEKLLSKPKLLPCLHSFCSACLEKIIKEDEDIVCPKCSEKHGLAGKDEASSLPKDVLAESLIYMGRTGNEKNEAACSSCDKATEEAVDRCLDCGEFLCSECSDIHRRLRQTRDHEIIRLQDYDGGKVDEEIIHRDVYCDAHPSEEIRYFCEKCKQIVCRECTMVKHKNHKYTYMEGTATAIELDETLENFVQKLQTKINKVDEAIEEVNSTFDLITGSIASLKNSVRQTATEMVRYIRVAEEEMITEIDRVQSRKFHGLNEQRKDLEMNLENFQTAKCYTENALKYLSKVELFLLKDPVTQRLKSLSKKKINHDPVEDNNLKHVRKVRRGQKLAQGSLGYLELNGNMVINKCVRDLTDYSDHHSNIREITTEPSPFLKGITVDIRGPGGEFLNPLKIERGTSGDFGADFQTERTGVHNVLVSIDGVQVGSPLEVIIGDQSMSPGSSPVPSQPPQFFGNFGRTLEQLDDVHGIVTDNEGQIVVTDSKYHRVQIFDNAGQLVRMFGRLGEENSQLNSPHGVAVTQQGHLVIADTGNGRIQIFDSCCKYLRSINCHGNDEESFRPYGVAVDDRNCIITVDRENCKVRIYTQEGQITKEFGSVGSGDCQFINPSYVTVNKTGHIIVSDMGNDRVQVFTRAGQLLFKFGKTGSGDGEFRWPTGIAVKMNDDIVVADSCNNRIQTFRADGSFISCRGPLECSEEDRLKSPEGVTVDKNDMIMVADWGNSRVQILSV